jgi:hypothetical protein
MILESYKLESSPKDRGCPRIVAEPAVRRTNGTHAKAGRKQSEGYGPCCCRILV